jgi:protein-S-isoprenylcysteine O-methyltransferase Ste14
VTREFGLAAFTIVWGVLLAVAVLGQALWGRRARSRAAGYGYDLLVFVPFILVFALASLPPRLGRYQGNALSLTAGLVAAAAGLALYLVSHLYLRSNWSVSASISQGQELVTTGPYARVRHPMYAAMVLIIVGSGLLVNSYFIILAALPVAAVYYLRAGKEEELLNQEFPAYQEYATRAGMFFPHLR